VTRVGKINKQHRFSKIRMDVEIKIIEEHTDEERFAQRVGDTMKELNTTKVEYAVVYNPGKGYLYSAMIIKII